LHSADIFATGIGRLAFQAPLDLEKMVDFGDRLPLRHIIEPAPARHIVTQVLS
jgi:hypothetical protein